MESVKYVLKYRVRHSEEWMVRGLWEFSFREFETRKELEGFADSPLVETIAVYEVKEVVSG